jgi:hypothetical protein
MLRFALASMALISTGSIGALAHTTDNLHPHPHSMDLGAAEGIATLALMLALFGFLAIARHLSTSRRKTTETRRGHR